LIQLKTGDGYLYDKVGRLAYKVKIIENPMELSESEWKRVFGFNLRRLLTDSNIKQYELAKMIGRGEGTVSSYANGENIPNAYTLHKIESVLRCSQDDLFPTHYIPLN